MVTGNTETNISVTYDDSAGKLNFVSVNTQLSNSEVTAITNPLYAKLSGGNNFSGNQTISGDVEASSIDINKGSSESNPRLNFSHNNFSNSFYIEANRTGDFLNFVVDGSSKLILATDKATFSGDVEVDGLIKIKDFNLIDYGSYGGLGNAMTYQSQNAEHHFTDDNGDVANVRAKYKSADGSEGMTTTFNGAIYKNGLFVGTTA